MSFLNSAFLFLTTLALIPILIHLFNRQRIKKIEFSSIRYLQSLQKSQMRRLKAKQILLLILRTLIILALVLAFARPTTRGSYSSTLGSAAPASVIILMDNSLSMSTETREGSLLELAKQQAQRICAELSPADQIAVVTFNQAPKLETSGFTSDHAFVRHLIDTLPQTHLSTNPAAAINAGFELLKQSRNLVQEIYLISDLAGPGWEGASFQNTSTNNRLKIYISQIVKKDYDNVKVSSLDFGNSLIYPGRPADISSEIINESSRRVDNLLVSLFVDGKRVAQTGVSISARGSEKVSFSHTFGTAGEHQGFVEIMDDDLMDDNRRYFTIRIPELVKVLTLNEKDNDDLFLRLAFKPLPESPTQIETSSESISRLATLNLFDYNCVILSGSLDLSPADFSKLTSYIKTGGSLLMFLMDDKNRAILNEKIFSPAFGAQLERSQTVKEGEGFFRLSSLDHEHPIFSRFKEIDQSYLPQIDFFGILKLSNPAKGKILATFSTGTPAMVEAPWGKGKIIAFLSSFSGASSDLATHPFFVTLVNRTVEYLAYDLSSLKENYLTGQTITKSLSNISTETLVEVLTPTGEKIIPAYNFVGSELNLTIPGIGNSGICNILADGKKVQSFAVNFPADESDGRFLDFSDLKKTLTGSNLIELPPDKISTVIIRESRLGKELSRFFFILALILLAAEMILARTGPAPAETAKSGETF